MSLVLLHKFASTTEVGGTVASPNTVPGYIIIIIMTRRQLRSVATTLHDDRDPVPSSTPV